MNESEISRQIKKSIIKECEALCYIKKIVANGMMGEGMLDIMGCINGRFIAIETKFIKALTKSDKAHLTAHFTENQILNALQIQQANGNACGLVYVHPYKTCIIIPVSILKEFNAWTVGNIINYCTHNLYESMRITPYSYGLWNVKNLIEFLQKTKIF